jgi:hypothetical protein
LRRKRTRRSAQRLGAATGRGRTKACGRVEAPGREKRGLSWSLPTRASVSDAQGSAP